MAQEGLEVVIKCGTQDVPRPPVPVQPDTPLTVLTVAALTFVLLVIGSLVLREEVGRVDPHRRLR